MLQDCFALTFLSLASKPSVLTLSYHPEPFFLSLPFCQDQAAADTIQQPPLAAEHAMLLLTKVVVPDLVPSNHRLVASVEHNVDNSSDWTCFDNLFVWRVNLDSGLKLGIPNLSHHIQTPSYIAEHTPFVVETARVQ